MPTKLTHQWQNEKHIHLSNVLICVTQDTTDSTFPMSPPSSVWKCTDTAKIKCFYLFKLSTDTLFST